MDDDNNQEYEKGYDEGLYNKPVKEESRIWVIFIFFMFLAFVVSIARLIISGDIWDKPKTTVSSKSMISKKSGPFTVKPSKREYRRVKDLKEENKVIRLKEVKKTDDKPVIPSNNTSQGLSSIPKEEKTDNSGKNNRLQTETSTEINPKISDNEKPKLPEVRLGTLLAMSEEEMIDEVTKDFQTDCVYTMSGLVPFPVPPLKPDLVKPFIANIAIEKDYGNMLEKLCKSDFYPVGEDERYHALNSKLLLYTILYAAEKDKRNCVDILIKNGADLKIEAQKPKDNNKKVVEEGKTLLHCAAQNGNGSLMKRVIDAGVPIDKKTLSGKTPLYFAVKNNQYESAYILINKGAVREESLKSETNDERMLRLLETGKY